MLSSLTIVTDVSPTLHRAVLYLVAEWSVRGTPETLLLNLVAPNAISVVTEAALAAFIRDELYRRALNRNSPIWGGLLPRELIVNLL